MVGGQHNVRNYNALGRLRTTVLEESKFPRTVLLWGSVLYRNVLHGVSTVEGAGPAAVSPVLSLFSPTL